MIPDNFKVNVDQEKPFNLHITIGQNVLILGAISLIALVYLKKKKR